MPTDNRRFGDRGEELAEAHLARLGHDILERNYACRGGEIDRITLDRRANTLCFVEVKTRADERAAPVEAAVTPAKRKRMQVAARHYLRARGVKALPHRFDVIAIVLPESGKPDIRHYPNCL